MPSSRWYQREDGCVILCFGRYSGSTIQEIDTDYLKWVVKSFAEGEGFDNEEDLIVLIEEELRNRGVEFNALIDEGGDGDEE